MSNFIWNQNLVVGRTTMNPEDEPPSKKRSIQLSNIDIIDLNSNNRQINSNHHNQVTNASSGFSIGIQREIASIGATNLPNLNKQITIDEKLAQNNSMSVSSISGLTPLTDNPLSSSIIQCSDNWKLMQQNMVIEEKQNKKELMLMLKIIYLNI